MAAELVQRLRAIGFEPCSEPREAGEPVRALRYRDDYEAPAVHCRVFMVPHGQTPANEKLFFQSHDDGGEDQCLVPEGRAQAEAGARAFLPILPADPGSWMWLRSPLLRAAQTAEIFREVAGPAAPIPDPEVDAGVVELDHGPWHGRAAHELEGEDGALATAFRAGDFFAAPTGGAGESAADLVLRARQWLESLNRRFTAGTTVVVFGHGMFQNAVETVLRTYPEKTPAQVFTRRKGQSHLRRGHAHLVTPAA
eukprot:TRINITY_DN34988_c0_g1_i1.p1 TRINITY_DN34988_c0_g1~~TRINITY_DN34988_c0_g1_i1.p1  ORF type:complete len:278 (+),score=75.01 TRINITY_DN34988_c0_g1_i1:78-836(+)